MLFGLAISPSEENRLDLHLTGISAAGLDPHASERKQHHGLQSLKLQFSERGRERSRGQRRDIGRERRGDKEREGGRARDTHRHTQTGEERQKQRERESQARTHTHTQWEGVGSC